MIRELLAAALCVGTAAAQSSCGTQAALLARIAELDAKCCGADMSGCSDGAVTRCSRDCADSVAMVRSSCATLLQNDGAIGQVIAAAAAVCEAAAGSQGADPCDPNPCSGGLCIARPADSGNGHRRRVQDALEAFCPAAGPLQPPPAARRRPPPPPPSPPAPAPGPAAGALPKELPEELPEELRMV